MKVTTGWIQDTPKLIVQTDDGRLLSLTDSIGDRALNGVDALLARGVGPAELRRLVSSLQRLVYLDDTASLVFSGPIWHPHKILCVGLNYREHIAEGHNQRIANDQFPTFFVKTNNTLSWPGRVIHIPTEFDRVDWEGELAVVIGKPCHRLAGDSWQNVVLGYTIANDLSERRLQRATSQWFPGKSVNGFCPLGPWIAVDHLDPENLRLTTTVNGRVMQDASTAQMIFSIGDLLSYLTSFCDLEPGDVVLTGTPSGVGVHRNPRIFHHQGAPPVDRPVHGYHRRLDLGGGHVHEAEAPGSAGFPVGDRPRAQGARRQTAPGGRPPRWPTAGCRWRDLPWRPIASLPLRRTCCHDA